MFARDYRVIEPLAEGGMGAVYLVEQASTGKRRALKVMQPSLVANARSRDRFAHEARVGARIASTHIVEVMGAGVDDATGAPWLAMELLDGEDLAALSRRRGPLPYDEVRALLSQACHALAAAHAVGVVHCDLKPENLFVARSQQVGVPFVVKVLDFGIARLMQEGKAAVTMTTAIGSPLWMAPEQTTAGAQVSPATDVWALGLVAFSLLTGRSYWRAANVEPEAFNVMAQLLELMTSALEGASARSLSLGGPALPPAFDAWFARCVARDPGARFAEAGAAFAALAETSPTLPMSPTQPLSAPAPEAPAAPGLTRAVDGLSGPELLSPPQHGQRLPPAVQHLTLEEVTDDTRAKLRALAVRARREGLLFAGDNLGGALAPGVLGVFYLLVITWIAISQGRYDLIARAGVVVAGLVLLSVWLVRRRQRKTVGTYLQPTEAYFVRADGGTVELYSWASLRGVRLVEKRLNGMYVGTNVEMDFGGTPLVIAAQDLAGAMDLRRTYEAQGEAARRAVERGAWATLEGANLV